MNQADLIDTSLQRSRHICAFFHSKEDEYRVLMPFITDGFRRGERAFHIVNPGLKRDHVERLKNAGVEVTTVEASGQLEIRPWHEAYLRDGHFDQDRMLALIEEVLKDGAAKGYPLTRLVADMEWAREDRPGCEDIVAYETRLNHVLPNYRDPVCCTYDLSKFGADVVMDILRTHPFVILGGALQENPFYVEPDQMLAELRSRRVH
jgi:hypothetical protein